MEGGANEGTLSSMLGVEIHIKGQAVENIDGEDV